MADRNALRSDIRKAIINKKANACPMAVRLAWHASGTFDKADSSGGSDGATMRFEPECSDGANAGLSIMRDMLLPVKHANPEVSHADIWTAAGADAVAFLGGPTVPHSLCRTDAASGESCPPVGRLPDASQGAAHLRDVFYRMGFDDRGIVCLSGAHTLGRCHAVRSGYDGPWTRHPLKFDNQYFKNLLNLTWKPRKWDGPLQYQDEETGELMMLPTDLALVEDPAFKVHVEAYANDEQKFFDDFAQDFAKLLALGTKQCPVKDRDAKAKAGLEFREAAMHGSLEVVQRHAPNADVHEREETSGRTALHKAAFWGHIDTVKYLVYDLKLDVNVQDFNGDTALHDATRFGHLDVVKVLADAGADISIANAAGQTATQLAQVFEKPEVKEFLEQCRARH